MVGTLSLYPPYDRNDPRSFRLTPGDYFMRDHTMNPIRSIFFSLSIAAVSPALAETVKFEDAAGLLGASCAKDIDTKCRGVNLDPTRLKDCLFRNEDLLSPPSTNDSGLTFAP